jgi:nitroreductase
VLRELVVKNRSFRRFDETHAIDKGTLRSLIDLARLSPSGANLQPLKYMLSITKDRNDLIFPLLSWAGYLKDWSGPVEGERPSAYIVILGDTDIRKNFGCDHGIAAQSIMLGAAELGLGGCMIASIQKDALREALKIPDHLEILLVLALGKPVEEVVLEALKPDGDIKYWRDENQVHHVPKRDLGEIILPD